MLGIYSCKKMGESLSSYSLAGKTGSRVRNYVTVGTVKTKGCRHRGKGAGGGTQLGLGTPEEHCT